MIKYLYVLYMTTRNYRSKSTRASTCKLVDQTCYIYTPTTPVTTTFSTVGTIQWTVPKHVRSIEYLIVGGGGGGGSAFDNAGSGGGGGGMVLMGTVSVTPQQTYTVIVGDGGAGGTVTTSPTRSDAKGSDGENSAFGNIVALGGDGGFPSRNVNGKFAGAGGNVAVIPSVQAEGGSGGGGGGAGGGGGGSGGAGGNRVNASTAGVGGAGTVSDFSGTSVTYGTGGNGGVASSNSSGTVKIANLGEGGDGAGSLSTNTRVGGNGSSGIVILKYLV